jgi:hypothetical protein
MCPRDGEGREIRVEFLKIFTQGDEHEETVELGSTTEGDERSKKWLKILDRKLRKR